MKKEYFICDCCGREYGADERDKLEIRRDDLLVDMCVKCEIKIINVLDKYKKQKEKR